MRSCSNGGTASASCFGSANTTDRPATGNALMPQVSPARSLRGRAGAGPERRNSIGSSVARVMWHVCRCRSMAGSPRRGSSRTFIHAARCCVCSQCGGTRLATPNLTTRPRAPCVDGSAWSLVLWTSLFEQRQHVLSAITRPARQRALLLLAEHLSLLSLHRKHFVQLR